MTIFTMELAGRPPSANKQRGSNHRMQTARETKQWREAARLAYLDMRNTRKAPKTAGSIAVTAQQMSKDRRWLQDIGGCMPAVKAAIDGLVDGGLMPDDTPEYLTSLTFLPPDVCGRDGLRLTIYCTGRKAAT